MLAGSLIILVLNAFATIVISSSSLKDEIPEGVEFNVVDVDPFRKISFQAPGSSQPTPQDSQIHRRSLPNFEIIYTVAASFDSNLLFNDGMNVPNIIGKFSEFLQGNPWVMLAAFIYRRDTRDGYLLKTPEHRGPIFMVLDQTDNGYEAIPAVVQLVNNSHEQLKVTSFRVQPTQLFLGFPANFNIACWNGLFLESSGWFTELPADEAQIRYTFSRRLQYKNANINTEVAFARLGDAHKAVFSKADPWKVQEMEAEIDELMPFISYSPFYDQYDHNQLEMAPASQHLPIQLHQSAIIYPFNYAYQHSIPYLHNPDPAPMSQEALQRERLLYEITTVAFLGFVVWAIGSTCVPEVAVGFLWEGIKWYVGLLWWMATGFGSM